MKSEKFVFDYSPEFNDLKILFTDIMKSYSRFKYECRWKISEVIKLQGGYELIIVQNDDNYNETVYKITLTKDDVIRCLHMKLVHMDEWAVKKEY